MILRARDRELRLGGGTPALMGIVNATPDSFSDGGELPDVAARVARARELVAAGAAIVDVGGETASGLEPAVAAEEEAARIVPVIERVAAELDVVVSVDTHKPSVAEAAVAAGAHLVNDVSGLRDPAMAALCARTGAALVITHTRARPKEKVFPHYEDVVADVVEFLQERERVARSHGVAGESIVLDPGIDLAKTPAESVELLRRLDRLAALGRPLLVAVSRKDFIGVLTERPPAARDAGTLAAVGAALRRGARILRVHDVAAARDYLRVHAALEGERAMEAGASLEGELMREHA